MFLPGAAVVEGAGPPAGAAPAAGAGPPAPTLQMRLPMLTLARACNPSAHTGKCPIVSLLHTAHTHRQRYLPFQTNTVFLFRLPVLESASNILPAT